MRVDFGLSSYERGQGDMPELPVVNLYAEEAPTEQAGIVLQSRPGLSDRAANMGGGPVDCLFKRDLILDGALFGVSNSTLYEGAAALGAVDGAGPFSIAGYEGDLFVAGGAGLWNYNGTSVTEISFPDSQNVLKVVVGASRVLCITEASGAFYWSDSLETNIDALDFATAENQPDRLLDILFHNDAAILFGAETVEPWPNTSDSDLPFQPLEQGIVQKGVRATGCASLIGNTFAWVTNDNQIWLADGSVISNPGLEAKIAASATCRLFSFILGGNEFLALRIDGETHAWPLRTRLWNELQSYGQSNFIPQCFAGGVFGSAIDGRTLEWADTHLDLGGVLERRFRAGFWATAATLVGNLILRCNVGQTTYLSGDYVNPAVEMRISLDHGQTWGSWRSQTLGIQGDYTRSVLWRMVGQVRRWKAFLAEFRVTAPIDWRISDVLVNEPYGGR